MTNNMADRGPVFGLIRDIPCIEYIREKKLTPAKMSEMKN